MIDTERLHLRPYRRDDLRDLHALTASDEARRFLAAGATTLEDSHARLMRTIGGWALDGFSTFAACDQATAELVGNVGLFRALRSFEDSDWESVEAGWIVAPERWGEGLATEAMTAALAWFDRTHGRAEPRTCCMIVPGNGASERIAARLGYRAFREARHKGDPVRLYERVLGG